MIVSIFITIVTVMRNIWIRIGIIAVATTITFFLFDMFENNKMDENMQKFLKIDKYHTDISAAQGKIKANPADSIAIADLASAQKKLEKANVNYKNIKPLIANYDRLGAGAISHKAYTEGWLREIEVSRLKDDVRNANDYLVLESQSVQSPAKKEEFSKAKKLTEDYKVPLQLYLDKKNSSDSVSLDSVLSAIQQIYPIREKNLDMVKTKIAGFSIEKSLKKDILKADNKVIAWGIVGISIIFCLVYLYTEKYKNPTARRMGMMFKRLQLFSSAAFSIGHGGNDAQKVMGIIGAALIASGAIQDFSHLPNWVPVACYLAIGMGTMSGGWKIVKTMGTKITKVTPLEGVAAETAGAYTLFFTGQMGIPVSTTHTITGSIIGVGATKRLSAVRWGVTVNLLWAWIMTIPVSGLLAAGVYYIVQFLSP
jgi:phosphate/sulfate permease